MKRTAVLLFVKFPEPGRVKTRLAADVGAQRAVEIYRELVRATCAQLQHPVSEQSRQVIVHFDPAEKRCETERWLSPLLAPGATYVAQCGGDLGARLARAFAQAFDAGFAKAAVVGTDCVELTGAILQQAFASLDTCDCAIGPTADGGYYLLALKALQPSLFADIAWSTEHTLAHTLDRARAAGLSVALLPALHDVDTESDWKIAERFLKVTHERVTKSE